MADSEAVFHGFKKDWGEKVVVSGDEFTDVVRVPTGVFPFDLQTGGGGAQGGCNDYLRP